MLGAWVMQWNGSQRRNPDGAGSCLASRQQSTRKGVRIMIRKTLLSIAAVAALMIVGSSNASAFDGWHRSHFNLHQDLQHNEFHRQQYHAYRHQFPQSHLQHFRLHQNLNHDRFHDQLRHQRFHSYSPIFRSSGFGFGISPYGCSRW